MTRSPADVVIIGAGVVGTAIARTLAAYSLDLMLVDAATDVGTGTSKANTAILHTGFDAKPGSLESRLLSRGSWLLREYASAARIPVERTGALLVAWTPDQVAALPGIEAAARRLKLDFIPLFVEDYYLLGKRETIERPDVAAIVESLQSPQFVEQVRGIPGYDTSRTGEVSNVSDVIG